MNEPESIYRRLKLARQLFAATPQTLDAAQAARVDAAAARQGEIESLILAAPEAAAVVLPAATVEATLAEIRARYASAEDYLADLAASGLDEDSLRRAVARDLTVEAVLEQVASRAVAVSDTEVEIFYLTHRERFRRAETRTLRHVLITVNDTLPGSERAAAEAKAAALHARLAKNPSRFAEQALKHSECPTAMNGGLLGNVGRGQLFAELEPVAFALEAGGLSVPVESEMGFHVLYCDAVNPARALTLAEAAPSIRDHLEGTRRSICQKSWINTLRRRAVVAA